MTKNNLLKIDVGNGTAKRKDTMSWEMLIKRSRSMKSAHSSRRLIIRILITLLWRNQVSTIPSSRNSKSKISKKGTANGWNFKNLSRSLKYMQRRRKTKSITHFSHKSLWIARKFIKRRLSLFLIRLNFRDRINQLMSALIRLSK